MRMGMGLGGTLLLAVSGVVVSSDVSAVEGDSSGGRILMQVPTGVEHEFELAIGDVATGELTRVGKPAMGAIGGFGAAMFEGTVIVSGFGVNPVVIASDGSVSDFVVDGGIRGMPTSLGDGEHYLIDSEIYTVATGEHRPLASFSDEFGARDIHVDELAGDWLEIGNDNATVYVRLSALDTVRSLPSDGEGRLLRADGRVVWEQDREGSSALIFADLSAPGPPEVVAREFYSASPFARLVGWIGNSVIAGRAELVVIDPATGAVVQDLTAAFDLPPRTTVNGVIGDGPLIEISVSGGESALLNTVTGERFPVGSGHVVARSGSHVLWRSGDGRTFWLIDAVRATVEEIGLGDAGRFLGYPMVVGDRIILPGCFDQSSVIIELNDATIGSASPMCHVVPTRDHRLVAASTSWPDDDLRGGCSTPMVVEELGVGLVQTFPSACPLAWLVEP